LTVKLADTLLADVAVIVTIVAVETVPVLIVKLAALAPAGISREAGTVATFVLLLESETITPPAGAGVVAVTLPFEKFPLTGAFGLTVKDFRVMVCATPMIETKKKQRPNAARSRPHRNRLSLVIGRNLLIIGEQNYGARTTWGDTHITTDATGIQWQSSQGVFIGNGLCHTL
jgi:hypothetical protein